MLHWNIATSKTSRSKPARPNKRRRLSTGWRIVLVAGMLAISLLWTALVVSTEPGVFTVSEGSLRLAFIAVVAAVFGVAIGLVPSKRIEN